MRRLILLRHAEAVGKNAAVDFDRVLAGNGRAQMKLVAAYLAGLADKPGAAAVSPAARTRETWALASAALGEVPARFDRRIYDGTPEDLLAVIREVDDAAATAILVGHNPGIHEAAQEFVRDQGSVQQRLSDFPTASIATIAFAAASWTEVAFRAGDLVAVETPASLGHRG